MMKVKLFCKIKTDGTAHYYVVNDQIKMLYRYITVNSFSQAKESTDSDSNSRTPVQAEWWATGGHALCAPVAAYI